MVVPAPQVILIAGSNGSGKSTLAPPLLRDEYGPMGFVNADTIAQGLFAFRPQDVAVEAGRVMLRRLRDLARKRSSFAFESTLAGRSYVPWLSGLRQEGYEFHLLFLWLRSPELAILRVRTRVQAGGHDVPEKVIRRRYFAGVKNFINLYRTLADAWVVYDNSTYESPSVIASGSGDALHHVFDAQLWRQFEKLGYEKRK